MSWLGNTGSFKSDPKVTVNKIILQRFSAHTLISREVDISLSTLQAAKMQLLACHVDPMIFLDLS